MTLSSEDWEKRKTRITGTKIAAIAGLNIWEDRVGVYQEMTGQRIKEKRDNFQSDAMLWGIKMEPILLDWFKEKFQAEMTYPGTVCHKTDERFGATPDALAHLPDGSEVIVEAKTSSKPEDWGNVNLGLIAPYYWPQICWEMMCCDVYTTFMVVHTVGVPLIYEVHRNETLEKLLVEMADEFWNDYILPKRPPIDYKSKNCANLLEFLNQKRTTDIFLESTVKSDNLVRIYLDARAKEEQYQTIKTASENQLKEIVGTNAGIKGVKYAIHWQDKVSKYGNPYRAFTVRELGGTRPING